MLAALISELDLHQDNKDMLIADVQLVSMLTQTKIYIILYTLWSVLKVSGSVIEQRQQQAPGVTGSLILWSVDNSTRSYNYDSSSLDCGIENLPGNGMKISRVEVTSASFTLHRGKNGRGRSQTVTSLQHDLFSHVEVGMTRVRSIRREGCSAEANVALVVVLGAAGAVLVTLAAFIVIRRKQRARIQPE